MVAFYLNDLPILMDICKEVREISIQDGLNRSQTRALETLKTVSQEEFQKATAYGREPSNSGVKSDGKDCSQIELRARAKTTSHLCISALAHL